MIFSSDMEFIITRDDGQKAESFEIREVDTAVLAAEQARAMLKSSLAEDCSVNVIVRTYEEVAHDLKASEAEMEAAGRIFLKRTIGRSG